MHKIQETITASRCLLGPQIYIWQSLPPLLILCGPKWSCDLSTCPLRFVTLTQIQPQVVQARAQPSLRGALTW